jgi:hypothetical protein
MELVVDLEPAERCPRMPGPDDVVARVEGIELPRLRLPVGQADGWIRVRAAIADGLSFFSRR